MRRFRLCVAAAVVACALPTDASWASAGKCLAWLWHLSFAWYISKHAHVLSSHAPSFFFLSLFFCWIFKDLNKDESATQLIEGGRVALAGDVVFLIDVSNSVADYGCQSIDQLNERINQFTRGVFNSYFSSCAQIESSLCSTNGY